MADFGITDSGFVLKRLADILSSLQTKLSSITDPETGETLAISLNDENDVLAQVVNAFGDGLSEAWEQLQLAYNQFDPLKATGAGLKGTVQLNGIIANSGYKSEVLLHLTGTPGLIISSGKQASTEDGTVVYELPEVTFDDAGEATVVAVATEEGELTAAANTVTKIVTPVAGWTTVNNPNEAIMGALEESDSSIKARQQVSTSLTAKSIVESIASGILDIDGVTFCKVYQNLTLTTDARSIPAKSIAVVVVGGDNTLIANAIFNRNPLAGTYGSTSITITDSQGFDYTINFLRPSTINIYIDIDLTVINSSIWSDDSEDLIKEAILGYANSGASALGITTGFDTNGYTVGESVYASELYLPISSVLGAKINSVKIGTTSSPTGDEVIIDWDEIAGFDSSRITITETT